MVDAAIDRICIDQLWSAKSLVLSVGVRTCHKLVVQPRVQLVGYNNPGLWVNAYDNKMVSLVLQIIT